MNYETASKADIYKAVVFTVGLIISAMLLSPLAMRVINFVLGGIKV